MTKMFAILLLAVASLAAQTGTTAPAAASKTTKKTTVAAKTAASTASKPLTIPADAVANADGTFAYTDKEGRKWTYLKTPFGVVRSLASGSATATPAAAPTSTAANVKVTEMGDKVRFETATPFGTMVKEKNKADLTDDERALVSAKTAKQD